MSRFRNRRVRWILLGLLCVIILVVGFGFIQRAPRIEERRLQENLLERVKTASSAVNFRRVMTLSGSINDAANPDFIRLNEQLNMLSQCVSDVHRYCILREKDDDLVFLCYSELFTGQYGFPLGQSVVDVSDEMKQRLLSGTPCVFGPWCDGDGVWISAAAPILDLNNIPVAMLMADIDAHSWDEALARSYIFPTLILVLALMSLILGYMLYIHKLKERISLELSEAKFYGLFNNALLGICRASPNGECLDVNPAFALMCGFDSPEEMKRAYPNIRKIGANQKEYADIIRCLERTGTVERAETEIYKKDGSTIHVRLNLRRLMDINGNPTCHEGIIEDITDRKNAENALQESENRLRAIIHGCPICQFVIDREHRLIFWNKTVEIYTGILSEEIVGTSDYWRPFYPSRRPCLVDFIVDGRTDEISKWYGDKCAPSKLVEGAYEGVGYFSELKEGAKWLAFTAAPIRDSDGVIVGAIETLEDITERQKAHEELVKSEARFAGAFYSNAITMSITALEDGRFMEANDMFMKTFGYDREEVIGKTSMELGIFPNIEVREEIIDIVKREGYIRNHPVYLKKKDGEFLNGLFFGQVLNMHESSPCMFVVMQDMTEFKRMEQALRESESKYRQLFNSGGDGVFLSEISDRGVCGRFIEVNDVACERLGYTRDELLSANVEQIDIESPTFGDDSLVLKRLNEEGHALWESFHMTKDGRVLPVEINAYIIEAGGKPAMLATVRDITERKKAEEERMRLEEQLSQSQKMESIGKLAGGVAHDFNNILAVILGYGELMLSDLPDDSPMREEVMEIIAAGNRAKDLTRQLLAFSRKQVLDVKTLNINDAVRGLEKMIKRLIGEDIQIRVLTRDYVDNVNADLSQLEQVILNLCVNARDAMPEGGTLTIETGNAWLDEHYAESHPDTPPGPYVMMSVSDSGCGMDDETQRQIFEPFFTTKGKGKGTGLGLATVFGIVKQHGGNIWVYSEIGGGSTFKVYLPAVRDEKTGILSEQTDTIMMGSGETILVVEDEDAVRRLAIQMLRRLEYEVIEARSGEECLDIARDSRHIDMLLSDVIMPGMNGRQLYKCVLELRPEIRVLFMSGYTENVIAHHGILEEGIQFIPKPFTEVALSRKVHEVLNDNHKVS